MTSHLTRVDLARMARGTFLLPLSTGDALALLDDALTSPEPLLVPARFDRQALRSRAADGSLPPLLGELTTVHRAQATAAGHPPRKATAGSGAPGVAESLVERLSALTEARRSTELVRLVYEHVAAVLGRSSVDAVEPHSSFRALGCDSLTSVELRNRLSAATGLRLPATLVYAHPTPAAVAEYLLARLVEEGLLPDAGPSAAATAAGPDAPASPAPSSSALLQQISTATHQELLQLIDQDFDV
jgi:polyketide synthase 12